MERVNYQKIDRPQKAQETQKFFSALFEHFCG
jgi:hypothetical protein